MANICRFTIPASQDIEGILDYIADQNGIRQSEVFRFFRTYYVKLIVEK